MKSPLHILVALLEVALDPSRKSSSGSIGPQAPSPHKSLESDPDSPLNELLRHPDVGHLVMKVSRGGHVVLTIGGVVLGVIEPDRPVRITFHAHALLRFERNDAKKGPKEDTEYRIEAVTVSESSPRV